MSLEWRDSKFAAMDFETSGKLPEYALQPWRVKTGEAWPTSLATIRTVQSKPVVGGGLNPTKKDMKLFLEEAADTHTRIVGWNTAFDIAWLLAYDLETLVFANKWLDGMLLWRHWLIEPEYDMARHHKKSYTLKNWVREFMPKYAGYEEDIDFHNPDLVVRQKLHKYNVRDTLFTLRAAKDLWSRLLESDPRRLRAALIEADILPHVAMANLRGLPVDPLSTHELQAHLTAKAGKALKSLEPHGVTEKIVRSPTQLATLLYDTWKLPVLKENTGKKTGKTTRSTDKEVLHELSFQDERAKTLKEYREALNNKTKFADGPDASREYNGDGRVRPSAIIFGTYSGRLTYASKQGRNKDERPIGFALHQEKRDKEFRRIIRAPEGYTLMEFDAAGQEFRWMAIASNDPVMLNLCMPGEDPHSYMGAQIAHRDYQELIFLVHAEDKQAGNDRKLGKVANLCVAEGTLVLTDRGVCSVEQVRPDDFVWDGIEFVKHGGVVCSGVRRVMTYHGLTATPTHGVLSDGRWFSLEDAARYGRAIEPALGTGWQGVCRSTLRIMDGIVRRAIREKWSALREGAVRLWGRARSQLTLYGDRALYAVQSMCSQTAACEGWRADHHLQGGQNTSEACERLVPTVSQSAQPIVSQLRSARDRVSLWFSARGGGVCQDASTSPNIQRAGRGPHKQQWSLRAWKLALGYTQREPSQQTYVKVYDIVNCGPRHRFAANGVIVHNSLQYRTSAPKLLSVARVQYNIPMQMSEAQHIHATYPRTYRKVPVYWEKQIAQTKRLGYVETFAGRRVQVTGNWNGKMGWSMGSTAINYRIQGTGADQKYLALSVLGPYLRKIGAYFAWDLHDGIYIWVPNNKVDKAAVDIKALLDNLPYQRAWGFTPPIPMPWDCKVGKTWGDLHEYKFK